MTTNSDRSRADRSRAAAFVVGTMIAAAAIVPRALIDYGQSGDALDNASDAQKLLHLGLLPAIPSMIRWPPGVPLFIYLIAPLVGWGGHLASNFLVAAFYVAAVVFFYLLARDEPQPLLLTAMFAFTPGVLLNAAVTQDFICGLASVLGAYWALRRGAIALCGLLIGLATGFRVTNALFVLPAAAFVLIQPQSARKTSYRDVAIMFVVAAVSGGVWYIPFLLVSGLGWRYFMPLPGHGGGVSLAHRVILTGYNWTSMCGIVGAAAILVTIFVERQRILEAVRRDRAARDRDVAFSLIAIALYAAVSFRFTMKAEYVLPAIPFAYLLLARWTTRGALTVVCVLVISANLVTVGLKGGESTRRRLTMRPEWGLTVSDWQARREVQELRLGLGELAQLGRAVVLTGMAGVLTADNAALEPVDSYAISPKLSPEATASEHRGAGPTMHRVKTSQVFLVTSIDASGVEQLRRDGYRVLMFSDYAPSAALNARGYDPYALGIDVLPAFGSTAFYRTHQLGRAQP